MAIGVILPFTPVGSYLGFTPLPPLYWPLLAVTLLAYVLLTQAVKTWLIRRGWMSRRGRRTASRPGACASAEADAALEIPKARIRAERIESRPNQDARIEPLDIAFLEPRHRLIRIAERGVDDGDLRRVRLVRARALLQLAEERFGFVSLAGCHVRAREVGYARRAAAGERDRFLELRDGLVGHVLLEVCLAQVIVREAEVRFHLDRLLALQDRFIVRVRKGQQLRQVGVDHERKRIDAFRLPHFHNRLVIPVQQREVPRIPVVSGGVAGKRY